MRFKATRAWGVAGFAILLTLAGWLFVGYDLYVGDHETGNNWVPFLKHRPGLQLKFVNPSLRGSDLVPFESLAPESQGAMIEYCKVRHGTAEPKACYEAIQASRV